MGTDQLIPTAEERSRARGAYEKAFHTSLGEAEGTEQNVMIDGQATIYALCRQYPEVARLLGNLNLDAPKGFGSIDVGLPHDPHYFHVVLSAEEFLELARQGQIVLNKAGTPDYIGLDQLRG